MRLRALSFAIALTLASHGAPAAAGQTLADVFAQAQRHNPTLRSAQAAYRAALSRVPLARSRLLPQIVAAAGLSDNAQDNSNNPLLQRFGMPTHWDYISRDVSLTATQALYRPGERISVTQAETGARIAYLQWLQANQELAVQVAAGYFDVLAAQDDVRSLQAQQKATVQQLAAARSNFAAGNGTIVDVRDAQARADLTAAQVLAAQNRVELARTRLQQLTGIPPGSLDDLAPGVHIPAPAGGVQTWADKAAQDNLAVRQALLAVDNARMQARKAATGTLPTVDAYARVDRASTGGGGPLFPFGNRADVATVGVQVQWSLFTGFGVQSQVEQSAHDLDRAEADLDAARLAAAQSARSAYLGVESGLAQVKALDAAIASSHSALDANETGYRVGMRVNIDVLNALSQLYETRRLADKARYDVLVGQLRLKLADGSLDARDVAALSALLQPG